jgi:RNA polymerase sigma factor (sigma-70 family)
VNETIANTVSDKSLVDKVLAGDNQAFSMIIKNTQALTAQIVFKMIDHAEDRKDLAQDIYLKVFSKLSGFRFESKLSTWIAQIAFNTCMSHLKKKKLVFPDDSFHEDGSGEEALELISARKTSSSGGQTETIIFQKEISSILKSETEKLSPIYKTLITLYHSEEMSYEEIGRITGLPEGTVKSYLFRARKTLKENLLSKYKKEEL